MLGAQAKVLARWGRNDEAEERAREALASVRTTELYLEVANALMTLGEVLRHAWKNA